MLLGGVLWGISLACALFGLLCLPFDRGAAVFFLSFAAGVFLVGIALLV